MSIAITIDKKPWAFSFATVLVLLSFTTLVCTPLLQSDDDGFFLYTLAGGYGEKPTHLLHYSGGWNPLLGWIIKSLFTIMPGINWYTILLMLFHLAGLTCMLYVLLQRLNLSRGLFFFLIIFCFTELRLLLYFNYTAASLVAAIGGGCLLIHTIQTAKKFSSLLLPSLLIVAAGLLRSQAVWLTLLLLVPFALLQLKIRTWPVFLGCLLGVGLLIQSAIWMQEIFYSRNISGWKNEESKRQSLFHIYNRQAVDYNQSKIFTDSVERELFTANFLYDTAHFNKQRLKELSSALTRSRSLFNQGDRSGLYWFFLEMRVYLLLMATLVMALWLTDQRRAVLKWFATLVTVLILHYCLFAFLKITMTVHLAVIMILLLHLGLNIKASGVVKWNVHKFLWIPFAIVLVFCFGWMGLRVAMENKTNVQKYQHFRCSLAGINSHPDQLFIMMDDSFPSDDFYIWDVPQKYPMHNILFKERMITGTWVNTTQRFGIDLYDSTSFANPKIYMTGKPLQAIVNANTGNFFSAPLENIPCLQVRSVTHK